MKPISFSAGLATQLAACSTAALSVLGACSEESDGTEPSADVTPSDTPSDPDDATPGDDPPTQNTPDVPAEPGPAPSGEPVTPGPTETAGDAGVSSPPPGSDAGATPTPGEPDGGSEPEPEPEPTRAVCDGAELPELTLTEIADGLSQPTFVTSAPNAAAPLFVTEKQGTLKRVSPADGSSTELLELDVYSQSESGLLGMAFHPNYGQGDNRRVWLSYISADRDSVVEEYTLDGDSISLVPGSQIVEDAQPRGNHNGGMVAFGPDGLLYVGIGDGGAQNDGDGNAQDLSNPLGKILRFDVDNPGTPPAGNLSGPGEDTRIFHHGFRNPWRFSFDRATGDFYVADVGQNAWEEITVTLGNSPGSDFGWPALEGTSPCTACMDNKPPVSDDMVMPQIVYAHGGSDASVTGGYVYRGGAIAGLAGTYFYADFEMGRIWSAQFDGEQVCDEVELTDTLDPDGLLDSVSSFGEDADGEIYVVNLISGTIYRIDPA